MLIKFLFPENTLSAAIYSASRKCRQYGTNLKKLFNEKFHPKRQHFLCVRLMQMSCCVGLSIIKSSCGLQGVFAVYNSISLLFPGACGLTYKKQQILNVAISCCKRCSWVCAWVVNIYSGRTCKLFWQIGLTASCASYPWKVLNDLGRSEWPYRIERILVSVPYHAFDSSRENVTS